MPPIEMLRRCTANHCCIICTVLHGGNNTRIPCASACAVKCWRKPLLAATPPPTTIVSNWWSRAQAIARFVSDRATVLENWLQYPQQATDQSLPVEVFD